MGLFSRKASSIASQKASAGALPAVRAKPSSLSPLADPPFVKNLRQESANPIVQGASGVTIYLGRLYYQETNHDLERWAWYGSPTEPGIADEMLRTDPHVRSANEVTKAPLIQGEWDFDLPTQAEGSPLELEMAAFNRYVFFEQLQWKKFLRQAMDYARAGFSLFEPTTDIIEVPAKQFPLHPSPELPNGMKRVLAVTGLEQRLPRTVWQWNMDPAIPSRVASVTQFMPQDDSNRGDRKYDGHPVIESVRANGAPGLLRFTYDPSGNNPEGIALQRSAYGAYKIKTVLLMIDAMRHERQNLGIPQIKLPPGFSKADEAKAMQIAEAIRGHERAYIVLPDGFTFEFNVSGSGAGTNIGEAIERCNRDIWMNYRATYMLLGNGDTGSYAMASTLKDIQLLDVEGHADLICAPFNIGVDAPAFVPWLSRQNYGAQPFYPRLKASNLPTRDWKQILPEIVKAVDSGVIIADDKLEDQVRLVMHLPKRDAKTARLSPKAILAAAKDPQLVQDELPAEDKISKNKIAPAAPATKPGAPPAPAEGPTP